MSVLIPRILDGVTAAAAAAQATADAADLLTLSSGLVAGTTQTQAGATLLTGVWNEGSAGTAGDGFVLPAGVAPDKRTLLVSGANSAKVYPAVGELIDGAAPNTEIDVVPGLVTLACFSDGVWYTVSGVA